MKIVMEQVCKSGRMEQSLKDDGRQTKFKDRASFFFQMAILMKVIGKIINLMEKGCIKK